MSGFVGPSGNKSAYPDYIKGRIDYGIVASGGVIHSMRFYRCHGSIPHPQRHLTSLPSILSLLSNQMIHTSSSCISTAAHYTWPLIYSTLFLLLNPLYVYRWNN